jgi:hypothetical protein
MKCILLQFLFIAITVQLFAQTNYKGFINKSPVELITNIYSDGTARAI